VRRLNLTPEQRLRLREIRRRSEPRARELMRRARLARRALDEAIYADAVDEALVEQRSRELAAAQAELVRLRAANELSVRRVLTPEQLRAFRELRREAQRRQSLRRRRGGGERPPPPDAPFEGPPDESPADPGGAAQSPEPQREGPPPARRRRP
jgi:Spy/CpxP family protein refolding chaperone